MAPAFFIHFRPIRPFGEAGLFTKVALYSLVVVLSAFALYDISVEESFAQPVDAGSAFVQTSFHRGISDSFSVASTFGSPNTPNHYLRTISESVSVSTLLPGQLTGQSQPQARILGDNGSAPRTAQSSPHAPSSVQRFDDKSNPFKILTKKTDASVRNVIGGTPYLVEPVVIIPTATTDQFADTGEGSDASDPDDNSAFLHQLALFNAHVSMEKSTQNAAMLEASLSAVLLVGTLGVMVARQPVISQGRAQRRILILFLTRHKAVLILTLAAVAISIMVVTITPSSGEEYAGVLQKAMIEITAAYHLGSDRQVLSDIFEETRKLDGIWSEAIPDGHYVRITFEQSLTSASDITIYPRIVSGEPRIEVYEVDGDELIAEFEFIDSDTYHQVLLTNLQNIQDTFDLRVIGGSVEFDHIIDPTGQQIFNSSGTFTVPAGVTQITVEAWGGGGGGRGSSSSNGGGGGGGAYARSVVSVTPGLVYTVTVGSGGTAGNAGGDSWFGSSSTILAKGGSSGGTSGGAGGSAGTSIGQDKFSGGAGANPSNSNGGGGGGSAFTNANGNPGSGSNGGTGTGNGGNGGSGSTLGSGGSGTSGNVPGGGGGGQGNSALLSSATGSPGASGRINVSWSIPDAPTLSPADGVNQIAFKDIRQDTTTPTFRVSATHTQNFNRFQLELNAASNFTGAAYTQTFSGTYFSGTQYNLEADSLSPSLPTTDGITYYVRVRASSDGGTSWGIWSSETWTFTKGTADIPYWFQATDAQFETGILSKTVTSGSGQVKLPIVATGGTITESDGYIVHTFTENGTFEVISGSGEVEYFVVGGGGGGGSRRTGGGGGGGGGVLLDSTVLGAGSYGVVVGAGGAGGGTGNPEQGQDGQNSSFDTFVATGGAGGGALTANTNPSLQTGRDGGSGGGGGGVFNSGQDVGVGGSGVLGQGHDGGDAFGTGDSASSGGGGGGAGGAGGNASSNNGGLGGDGVEYLGTTYATGGRGGWPGGPSTSPSGSANTGAGGGGSSTTSNTAGGNGGSGIVIIRYPTTSGVSVTAIDRTVTLITSNLSSHAVNIPNNVNTGDLLFALATIDGNPAVTDPVGGTWTRLEYTSRDTAVSRGAWYRVSDGSEPSSYTWATSAAEQSAWHVIRIKAGTYDVNRIQASTHSASWDPPSLTASWGSDNNLWIAYVGQSDTALIGPNGPSSYTNLLISEGTKSSAGASIATAWRMLGSADENPGPFDPNSGNTPIAATYVIGPPSGPSTITSPEIDSSWVPDATNWGEVRFSTSETNDSIKLRIYSNGIIIPDTDLPGNSAGFSVTASPIDISGFDTTTYNKISLQATFNDGATSLLEDWTVTWVRQPANVNLYNDDVGSTQIAFNNIRQNTITPVFRTSAIHINDFDRFRLELNTEPDFTGTSYTQAFSGTYISGTQYNLVADNLSPTFPATDGMTYYVRIRASDNGGIHWGPWSAGTWTFTRAAVSHSNWSQTTDAQFETGILTDSEPIQYDSAAGTSSGYSEMGGTLSNLTFDHTLNPGTRRMVVIVIGNENGSVPSEQQVQATSVTFGGRPATLAAKEQIIAEGTGTAGFQAVTEIWYLLEDDLPADGSRQVAVTLSGTPSALVVYGAALTLSNVKQVAPDVTVTNWKVSTGSNLSISTNIIPLADGSWLIDGLTGGDQRTLTAGVGQVVRHTNPGSSSTFGVSTKADVTATQQTMSWTHSADVNREAHVIIAVAPHPTTMLSPAINFDWVPGALSWGSLDWTADETNGNVAMQLYYTDPVAGLTLIPDSDLLGNEIGFSSAPVDLSGLDTATYGEIFPLAMLTSAGGMPSLEDWTVTWNIPKSTSIHVFIGQQEDHTATSAIEVGDLPYAAGVHSTANLIYVANFGAGTVSVIDGSTGSVMETIPVGTWPAGVAVNTLTNRVYVSNSLDNSISVIDTTLGAVTDTIAVGSFPIGIAINTSTNHIYVANFFDNSVSIIDGSRGIVIGAMTVGDEPYGITFDPVAARIYAANSDSNTVSVIDGTTNTIIDTITVGIEPRDVTVNPITNRIYVSNYGSNTVSVIDGTTNTIIDTITVGTQPEGITVNPITNRIYVANGGSNNVSVIDGSTNTVTDTLSVGSGSRWLTLDSATNQIYVTNIDSNNVSVIDNTYIDVLEITDSISMHVTRSLSDSVVIADTIASNVAVHMADSLIMTDRINMSVTRSMSDAINFDDEIFAKITGTAPSDELVLTDGISIIIGRAIGDNIAVSDTLTMAIGTSPISDTVMISDEITTFYHASRSASDFVAMSDLIMTETSGIVTDALTLFDSITKLTSKSTADSLAISDSILYTVSHPLADTLQITEEVGRLYSAPRSISDNLTVVDSVVMSITRPITDTVILTDAVVTRIEGTLIDGITISDSIAPTVSRSISDGLVIEDSTARLYDAFRTPADTLAIADGIFANIDGLAIADTIAVTDSITFHITKSMSDGLAATDVVAAVETVSGKNYRTLVTNPDVINTETKISIPNSLAAIYLVNPYITSSIQGSPGTVTGYGWRTLGAQGEVIPAGTTLTFTAQTNTSGTILTTGITTAFLRADVYSTDMLGGDVQHIGTATSATNLLDVSIPGVFIGTQSHSFSFTTASEVDLTNRMFVVEYWIEVNPLNLVSLNATVDFHTVSDVATVQMPTTTYYLAKPRSHSIVLADSVAVADDIVIASDTLRPILESVEITESINTSVTRSITEEIGISELIAPIASTSFSDGIIVTDTISKSGVKVIIDGLAITDDIVATVTSRVVVDELVISDNIAVTVDARSITDQLTVVDVVVASVNAKAIVDELTVQDGITAKVTTRALSDNLNVTDTLTVAVSGVVLADNLSINDTIVAVITIGVIYDNIIISDTITAKVANRAVGDELTIGDHITMFVGSSMTDIIVLNDAISVSAPKPLSDSLTVSDSIEVLLSGPMSEAVGISDAISIGVSRSITDILPIVDTLTPPVMKSITDTLSISDEIAAVSGKAVSIVDTFNINSQITDMALHWHRIFNENFDLGDCTPFACEQTLTFNESIGLGDGFQGQGKGKFQFTVSPTVLPAVSQGETSSAFTVSVTSPPIMEVPNTRIVIQGLGGGMTAEWKKSGDVSFTPFSTPLELHPDPGQTLTADVIIKTSLTTHPTTYTMQITAKGLDENNQTETRSVQLRVDPRSQQQQIVPALVVMPSSTLAGNTVSLIGTGFAPGSTVTQITLGATGQINPASIKPAGTIVVDQDGRWTINTIVPASISPGSYNVRAIGSDSKSAQTTLKIISEESFDVSLSTDEVTVEAGDPEGEDITMGVGSNGFGNPLELTVSNLPLGMNVVYSDLDGNFIVKFSGRPNGNTITGNPAITPQPDGTLPILLNISAELATPVGTYAIFFGTKDPATGNSKAGLVGVTVSAPGDPTITFSPLMAQPGSSINVLGLNFKPNETVSIQFGSVSSGGSGFNITPSSIATTADGSFSAAFTVPNVSGGIYQVKATSSSGHAFSTFQVLPVPNNPSVHLQIAPKALIVSAGSSGHQTITVVPIGLFSSNIQLVATPEGTGLDSVSFLPTSTIPVSPGTPSPMRMEVSVSPGATAGTLIPIKIEAKTSGSTITTEYAFVRVAAPAASGDFFLSASPLDIVAAKGTAVRSMLIVVTTGLQGKPVPALSLSNLPAGVTGTITNITPMDDAGTVTARLDLAISENASIGTSVFRVHGGFSGHPEKQMPLAISVVQAAPVPMQSSVFDPTALTENTPIHLVFPFENGGQLELTIYSLATNTYGTTKISYLQLLSAPDSGSIGAGLALFLNGGANMDSENPIVSVNYDMRITMPNAIQAGVTIGFLDTSKNPPVWTSVPTFQCGDNSVCSTGMTHFSSWSLLASGGGGGVPPGGGGSLVPSPTAFMVNLTESLRLIESSNVRATEIIEEFGGVRFVANLIDSVRITSRPVAYSTLQVLPDVNVLMTVVEVVQDSIIPPSAKAVLEVLIENRGESEESFALNFWYSDHAGTRAFELSRSVEVGPYETKRIYVDIPFTSPGTFWVTAEARSVPGNELLGFTRLTVTVPWLSMYLYILILVAVAIISGSAIALALHFSRNRMLVAAGAGTSGTAAIILKKSRKPRVLVSKDKIDAQRDDYDLFVNINLGNGIGGNTLEPGVLTAMFEFEIVNMSKKKQQFVLAYHLVDLNGNRMPESIRHIQISEYVTDLYRAAVTLPSKGAYVLHVEARTIRGRLLGSDKVDILSSS